MKNFNLVIVYEDGLSRSTTATKANGKADAIQHVLSTDIDVEKIINITVVEHIREDM